MVLKLFRLWIAGLLFAGSASAQNHTQLVTAYQYYFDTDPGVGVAGNGNVVPISPTANFSQTISINTPVLSTGLHNLYLRVSDEFGKWSTSERSLFYVQDVNNLTQTVTTYQYYFDTDPGVGLAGNGAVVPIAPTTNFSQTLSINTPVLSVGLHHLFIRAKDEFGKWSVPERSILYVQANTTTQTISALEYFFDNDPGVGNGTDIPVNTTSNINTTFTLGVPCLAAGTHHLYVRSKDEFGRWSVIEQDTLTTTSGVAAGNITPSGPVVFCTGDSVLLSQTATSDGFTYQWLESGNDIIGATNTTHVANSTGNYSLKITCGTSFSISNTIVVTSIPFLTYYADSDGDGFGVTENSQLLCSPFGIYTTTSGGDCDDANPTINPGVTETCNGIDDDCNGLIDEGDLANFNLKLFIEGYYVGNGFMKPLLNISGVINNINATDSITIELHDTLDPYSMVITRNILMHTDGTAPALFPCSIINHSYYLVIRHRNTIETWSKYPLLFDSSTVDFDLTRE